MPLCCDGPRRELRKHDSLEIYQEHNLLLLDRSHFSPCGVNLSYSLSHRMRTNVGTNLNIQCAKLLSREQTETLAEQRTHPDITYIYVQHDCSRNWHAATHTNNFWPMASFVRIV